MQNYASIMALIDRTWPNAHLTLEKDGMWQAIRHSSGRSVMLHLTRKEIQMSDAEFVSSVLTPALTTLRSEIEQN